MFTKSKNVSTEQSLLEKSKKITNSFTTMISELRNLNTELSNLEAQKEEETLHRVFFEWDKWIEENL